MVHVSVKWNEKVFENVDINVTEAVIVLKRKLYELSGIIPERQKIMIKGLLKDDSDLSKIPIKENQKIILVGTPECDELKKPEVETIFEEDLTIEQKIQMLKEKKIQPLPIGFINLGTTCYLNSVLQLISPMKELIESIKNLSIDTLSNMNNITTNNNETNDTTIVNNSNMMTLNEKKLCLEMKNLITLWTSSIDPPSPVQLVNSLRVCFPQFARMNPRGHGYIQQDAEECYSLILSTLENILPLNYLDDLLNIDYEVTMECIENHIQGENDIDRKQEIDKKEIDEKEIDKKEIDEKQIDTSKKSDEKKTTYIEHNKKITCHLGTQLSPVDHLHQGIKLSMEETLEKYSEKLGRTASYKKVCKIASLPQYLVLHFVRFEWKKAHDLARTEAGRAKVCRKVNFGQTLDLYEFLTENKKKEIKLTRETWLKRREINAHDRNTIKINEFNEDSMGVKNDDKNIERPENYNLKNENPTSNNTSEDSSYDNEGYDTVGQPTGHYQLQSIVTHQGRSADCGHYIGWKRKDQDTWYKFDDDKVSEIPTKLLDLTGGRSDYHIAILCLYKRLEVSPTKNEILQLN